LNNELTKIAQKWADRLASKQTLEHSGTKYKDQPLGENLAYKHSSRKAHYPGLSIQFYG